MSKYICKISCINYLICIYYFWGKIVLSWHIQLWRVFFNLCWHKEINHSYFSSHCIVSAKQNWKLNRLITMTKETGWGPAHTIIQVISEFHNTFRPHLLQKGMIQGFASIEAFDKYLFSLVYKLSKCKVFYYTLGQDIAAFYEVPPTPKACYSSSGNTPQASPPLPQAARLLWPRYNRSKRGNLL